jgi:hypothetical protein
MQTIKFIIDWVFAFVSDMALMHQRGHIIIQLFHSKLWIPFQFLTLFLFLSLAIFINIISIFKLLTCRLDSIFAYLSSCCHHKILSPDFTHIDSGYTMSYYPLTLLDLYNLWFVCTGIQFHCLVAILWSIYL